MKICIVPYKTYSISAKLLRDAIPGAKIILPPERSQWEPDNETFGVGWGCSNRDRPIPECRGYLNVPYNVKVATNKLHSFKAFTHSYIPTIYWTTHKHIAEYWLDCADTVICRDRLQGRSGRGIRVIEPGNDPGPSKLYTKYSPCNREYRIHVFNNEILDVTQKKRRNGWSDTERTLEEEIVKSHKNGYVMCRNNICTPHDSTFDAAKRAVKALGLDFGAVDIGERDASCVVFEVNTAPGIEGTTLKKYAAAIENWARSPHI